MNIRLTVPHSASFKEEYIPYLFLQNVENIEYMDPYSHIFKKYGQQYDIWPGGKVGLY